MSDQPRRTSSRIASQPDLVTIDWGDKWDDFEAAVFKTGVDKSSSSQDCAASLNVRVGSLIHTISGETGGGHAEMDALKQLIILCGYDAVRFTTVLGRGVTVGCTEKPCCYRCSCMLGALGIVATSGTKKSSKSMGSTQWGSLGPDERAFIEAYLGIKKGSIEALAT